MKKILSGVLAAGMIASMGVAALAAETADHDLGKKIGYAGSTALKISSDEASIYTTNGDQEKVPYGSTFYYPLLTAGSLLTVDASGSLLAAPATGAGAFAVNNDGEPTGYVESTMAYDYDYVRGIGIRTSWEEGREYVEGVEIVKKKLEGADSNTGIADMFANEDTNTVTINPGVAGSAFEDIDADDDKWKIDTVTAGTYGSGDEKYYYFLAVSTKSMPTETDENDLIGTIELRKTSDDNGIDGEEIEVDVNVELEYEVSDKIMIYDTETVLDFGDGDTEEWIDFEDHEYDYFVVDTCDQDDLVAKVTDTFNHEIGDLYPSANLHFFNGNYATFNRMGELTLTGCGIFSDNEEKFLYAVDKDGEIALVADSDSDMYDEYEEAFKIKTRTLGVYFISDEELDLVEDVVVTTPDDSKENPGTGAKA